MSAKECCRAVLLAMVAALSLCGCNYRWRPSVPAAMRTVAVPVFANETMVTALGEKVAAQTLRELAREGTFKIRPREDAAIEIQGVLKSTDSALVTDSQRDGYRRRARSMQVVALVSVVDRAAGKVLIDNRSYAARTTFFTGNDVLTAREDSSGRIAEEIARQIVDDLTVFDFAKGAGNE